MAQQFKFVELALRTRNLQDFRSASGGRLPEKQAGESGRCAGAAGHACSQVGLIPHPDRQSVHLPGVHAFFGVWWANRQSGGGQEFVYG